MWTKQFWMALTERALSTAAQSLIALIGTTAFLHELNWTLCLSAAALSMLLSVLKNIAVVPLEVRLAKEMSEDLPRYARKK